MPSLSVVMIVRDEAQCLGDCLAAIGPIADEIVIADTGSTDDTVAVAQQFGAKVFSIPWRDDFAWARNEVLRRATGDWLLHLDADELVDPENAARIRAFVDADGHGAHGAWITLANYSDDHTSWRWTPAPPGDPYAHGYAGYLRVPLVRLFKNGLGIEYREPIHENLGESLREIGAVLREDVPILIHHYGFDPDLERTQEKGRYYLTIARRKAAERPNEAKSWFDLAAAAHRYGDLDAALDAARRAVDMAPSNADAVFTLASIHLDHADPTAAAKLLEDYLARGSAPVHFASALGAIRQLQGDLDAARRWFELALQHDPDNILGRLRIARTLDLLGDTALARPHLEHAARIAPSLKEIGARLEAGTLRAEGERAFELGDTVGALRHFVDALALDPMDPLLHNNLGVALNRIGQPGQARASFERALALAPGMPLAAQNLAALDRSTGEGIAPSDPGNP